MSFPVIFSIGPLSLPAHLVFEVLAFSLGFRYFLHLRKNQQDTITESHRIWIFIGASLGALIGSRLLGVLENPSLLWTGKLAWWQMLGSKTMVGGLLGGLAGVEIMKLRIGEKRSSGDLFTYPLILGICIGRIGCFLNGTAEPVVGLETHAWTGMDLGDGRLRHPIALYEIAFLLLLWLLLYLREKHAQPAEGLRFRIFMIAYLGFRFGIDFIKPVDPLFLGLSGIQWACLMGLGYYRITIFKLIFRAGEIWTRKNNVPA